MVDRDTESTLNDTEAFSAVARQAPTALMSEWTQTHADAVLLDILGRTAPRPSEQGPDVIEIPLQFEARPSTIHRRRVSRVLPVAASIAVVAAGVLAAVLVGNGGPGGTPSGGGAAGQPWDPPGGLSNHVAIGEHQYAYTAGEQFDLVHGRPNRNGAHAQQAGASRVWVRRDGSGVTIGTGSQRGCVTFEPPSSPVLGQAGVAFYAALPTGVGRLNAYLRRHVHGSTSLDEAVFAAVSETQSSLASPRLRAALLAVLSRTPGVRLHFDVRDYLGRRAIRADFADRANRGSEIQSVYFDPTDFRLLETRESDGRPMPSVGPSPAYGAAPTNDGTDGRQLSGTGSISLIRNVRTVDHAPRCH